MDFVEKQVDAYDSRRTCSSTPPSSFQRIQSRLIRPAATTINLLQGNYSSSQHINPSRQAPDAHFVVNLAEGEEELSSFQQCSVRSCRVVATLPILDPSQSFPQHHMNYTSCNHFAADNLVVNLAEDFIGTSPATQPALQQSNQCSLEHIISHFPAHDGTLKKVGTVSVVQKLAGNKEEEEAVVQKLAGEREEVAADEINSSAPLSSFQLIQSRLIRPSPSTSVPTVDLHQTNQTSAPDHLAPLSVYQD